uniref:PWI domain-containing protein n=1 Tax=Physcomitrium patens TaxID=3218 RepID=A0A7I4EYN4_PHYPA
MDGAKFTIDLSSSGAAKLRECVKEKLSEYIGNDTDDVLVEYVVVLVGHGKEKSHAVKDLEAFLGGGSESFVSWLWDHMSVNKESYCKIEDSRPPNSELADEDTQQGEPSLRSVVTVVEHDEKTTTRMEVEELSEGLEFTRSVQLDDVNTVAEAGNSLGRRSRRRDGSRRNEAKRPRSPEIWIRRGGGRVDRPDVKEMSPPVVKASRRLLINAVREVFNESALLATKRDASKKTESAKRLQSVVSSDADLQGNGGTEVDMIHEIPAVELEPFAVEDRHFNRTSQLQQRQMQDKPVSVWDRIKLNDRSAQNNTNMFGAEGQFASVHFENRGKWKKNGAAGLRAGSGKGRGGREQRYRGAPYSGRTVDVYGHILEDALPSVNAEHMQNQDSLHRRNSFNSHKPGGQRSENGFSSSVGKVVGDEQVTIANEDVLEMKKRLRQVQLDMTKLRARQAEVSKEVQNSPAAGVRSIPFEPQPSQEDINDRSVFVTNVHFAATQAALRVHFGGCGYVNRVTLLVEPATGKPKGLVECNVYYELLDTLYLLNCSCCIMYPLEGPCKTVRIFMILSLRCVLADLLLWNLLQRMQ